MTDELSIRIRGDEAASPLAPHVRAALEAAFELNTKLLPDILTMQGASGRKYRMLINHLMGSIPNPRYLEIGSYMGSTACSAIYGNRLRITCIDNWSQFGGPREAFMANIQLYKNDTVDFCLIEEDFRKVEYDKIGTFNVYLFDGPHTYNDQFDGTLVSLPALDNEYVFVVDDWNWPQVRAGTLDALKSKEKSILYSVEIRTTQDDSHASAEGADGDWHNGYFIGVVRQRKQDPAPNGFLT